MPKPLKYRPPTPENLRALKDQLDLTGEQMAALFGLAGGQQWRKYTGGAEPREMSAQMLFYAAARLVLPPEQFEQVLQRMRDTGAAIELDARATQQQDLSAHGASQR